MIPTHAARPNARSLAVSELEARLSAWGEPAFRVRQILPWLYQRPVGDWAAMTDLPQRLRERLAEAFTLDLPALVTMRGAGDTTTKFLWRLRDGALVESVLLPASEALYGEPSDRHTLCVSTQVGCAYGCRFCASGLEGFRRNLTPDEIVGQVLLVERWHRSTPEERAGATHPATGALAADGPGEPAPTRLVSNLVIMGMGEPLANYANVLNALRTLNAAWGGGIGARKITVSTSGLAPEIRRLAEEPEQFRLAVSLHAVTNDVRDRVMPVNRKYPLELLLAACEHYVARKGRMITLEYILIAGLNDHPEHAVGLAAIARRLGAKVNLIPYNRVEDLPWERPGAAMLDGFHAALRRRGVSATLRLEKGGDIEAACGQLRLRVERAGRQVEPARCGVS